MSAQRAQQRVRNAAVTRAAILEAACARFAREGYDGASLRDLAADVGVDAALVCRYFGSKEELFAEVLSSCASPHDLMSGDPADFGARVAHMLMNEPPNSAKLELMLIILRSASSARAAEIVRRHAQKSFYGPLADWLGEPDGQVKAQAAAGVIMGFALSRAVYGDSLLDEGGRAELGKRIASLVQAAVS